MSSRANSRELFWLENKLYKQGFKYIAGVDEAGRGPLAGPLVSASVILPHGIIIEDLDDSKKLTPARRELLFDVILEKAIAYNIETFSHEEIDAKGLHNTNLYALKAATLNLKIKPDFILVDGYKLDDLDIPSLKVIKGDQVSANVAAASILAKVSRDCIMVDYHSKYPEYGFLSHKGYSCKQHFAALQKLGASPIHRKSFQTIKNL